MKTTLRRIKEHDPCAGGWAKLLKHLNKTEADDEELSLLTVLESNGPVNAIWALRCVDGHDREIRLYAVWCARQVQHLMTDPRSTDALDVAERFADGQATSEELRAAGAAAVDAAWDAAGDAAVDAAVDAAWAAGDAAWAAARAAGAAGAAGAAAWAAQTEELKVMMTQGKNYKR